jgi:hypothetical protein
VRMTANMGFNPIWYRQKEWTRQGRASPRASGL